MARFAYLDVDHPIAFAHRGGASEVPENTLPAFAHAVDLGYRYVETDVHVTADGVLVAFHDDHLDRVTDRTGAIGELPWSEVRRARVDGREPIPLLEDLLGSWPDLQVNIDPKADEAVDALVDVLRRCDAVDRVCIGAFSDERLARVRALLDDRVCTSLGPLGVIELHGEATGGPAAASYPSPCVQVPTTVGDTPLVTEAFVETAHRRGLAVHVWTIDDEPEMERLVDLGVDGIMTDVPVVLRQVWQRRGWWPSAG